MSTQPTADQLEAFRSALEEKLLNHMNDNFPALLQHTDYKVELEVGQKYARIVRAEYRRDNRVAITKSAYGFIDLTNGDLLKSAGWKAPAKHARGSLFNSDILKGCGPYGMDYLR